MLGLSEVISEAVEQHPQRLWFGLLSETFNHALEQHSLETLHADSVAYYLSRAALFSSRAQPQQAGVYYDSARTVGEGRARAQPENATARSLLGIAYAGTGLKELAIQEGRRGAAIRPVEKDAFSGPHWVLHTAHIMVLVGEYEQAVAHLDTLLRIPSPYSGRWLGLHPLWEPLRDLPAFRALVERGVERSFN